MRPWDERPRPTPSPASAPLRPLPPADAITSPQVTVVPRELQGQQRRAGRGLEGRGGVKARPYQPLIS